MVINQRYKNPRIDNLVIINDKDDLKEYVKIM